MARNKAFCEVDTLCQAADVFWQKGYHATSIQDLVTELGINRASLYSTYGGKQQLFIQAMESYQRTNKEAIDRLFTQAPTAKAGLLSFFQQAIDQTLSDRERKGCLVVNATTELAHEDPQLQKVVDHNRVLLIKALTDLLERGKREGSVKPNAPTTELAYLIYTFYSGMRVVGKICQQPSYWQTQVNLLKQLVLVDPQQ